MDPCPPRLCGSRSPLVCANGAVSSSQPLASAAGLRILQAGGNCVDAAIAVAAALNVTEPCSTGIGGDCFCLHYDASTNKVSGLNGSGRAPSQLTLDRVEAELKAAGLDAHIGKELPDRHIHTITVPGAAAGWVDSLEKWGSLPMADVLQPAIELAEKGFPVAPLTAYYWGRSEKLLQQSAELAGQPSPFLVYGGTDSSDEKTKGKAPRAGEIFRNPKLAETFRLLAQKGKDGFYKGRIAEAIVGLNKKLGGAMSLDDLSNHKSTFPEPISTNYHGVDVWEIPPNGQGITALIALNILESCNLSQYKHNSVEYLHVLLEAMRLAFADTRKYVADPDKVQVPTEDLLSKEYAAKRGALIDLTKATADVKSGQPVASSDTVSFCVVDSKGNACSFINSNYMGFGSCLSPADCGFTLQNRGANFSLERGHANVLAPNKRPYHTIIPGLATKDGKLYCPFSVMGGFMQPQGHVQVMLNMIDFHMDPQSALDAARFCIRSGTPNSDIGIESGITDETLSELKARGHKVVRVAGLDRSLFGRGQIILRAPNGVLWCGSDSRADGQAVGY